MGIRLYLDENLSPKIAEQLQQRGIDAVSARERRLLSADDPTQLAAATSEGRVLVTTDEDFLRLARSDIQHAGIIFGAQASHSIGDWVRLLELAALILEPEDMLNHVEFV